MSCFLLNSTTRTMPEQRQRFLTALDIAKIQYYHIKAIIVAGMGLFSDSYDLFCIPPIIILIGRIYYAADKEEHSKYEIPSSVVSIMVGIALLGTVIGQLVFGVMGDRKGRRSVYGLALKLMVFSSLGCGFSICRTRRCALVSLGFFRFFLGLGIGGDYPLSAVIISENANKNQRGGMMAAMFSLQGFGMLASSIVTMVVCKAFEATTSKTVLNDQSKTPQEADIAWRLILMLGAIPAALTYYWRMLMPETARFTALVENNVAQAYKDMEKNLDIPKEDDLPQPPPSLQAFHYPLLSIQFIRRYGLELFSCSLTWMILDVPFYGATLFQSQIYRQYLKLRDINYNAYEETFEVAKLQALVTICATIPGYFFTILLIDKMGRRKIQMMGFFCMGILYFALGIPYSYWGKHKNIGFMFLYGLTFFFANFGPNATTFIVPAELFPARFRTTCHGISGAMGKVGAFIGALGFNWASENSYVVDDYQSKLIKMRNALVILGVLCFMGMVVSYFLTPETMKRSLEDNENQGGNMELSLSENFTNASHP